MTNAKIEPLRELPFVSISGTYAAVGAETEHPTRLICFSNNTEGDMLFSRDATNNELFVAAGSFKLFDLQSNINPNKEDRYVFAENTQWYVKQITAPVSGSVYIEVIY